MVDPPKIATGRTSTMLSVNIRWSGGESTAFVRNISEMGALLECNIALERNEPVTLKREGMEINGHIVWVNEQTFGIRFQSPVDPTAWMSHSSAKTNLAPQVQSSSLKHLVEEGVDVSSLIDMRLSEEIAYVARMLENIGDIFTKDALLCNRYSKNLQNLSISIQTLNEICAVINSSNKIDSINSIVTGPMKARLLR